MDGIGDYHRAPRPLATRWPAFLAGPARRPEAPTKARRGPGAGAPLPACLGPDPLAAVVLAIGPEGGFDPQEERALGEAGFLGCTLGPRVLRTETAALAAVAAIRAIADDFGH